MIVCIQFVLGLTRYNLIGRSHDQCSSFHRHLTIISITCQFKGMTKLRPRVKPLFHVQNAMLIRIVLIISTVCLFLGMLNTFDYEDDSSLKLSVIKNSSNKKEKSISSDHQFKQNNVLPAPGVYWLPSQEVYFSSAFQDNRYNNSDFRILGLRHRAFLLPLFCVFENKYNTVYIPANEDLIYKHWPPESLYLAVIYTCKIPMVYNSSKFVEICCHKNISRVKVPLHSIKIVTNRKDLAICGKAYHGNLIKQKLIEWLEINKLLGIDQVIVYDSKIDPKGMEVLKLYKDMGFISHVKFPLLSTILRHATSHFRMNKSEYYSLFQQAYLVSLNDCIFRFMGQYSYFLIIDYDETLIPSRDESLYFTGIRLFHKYRKLSGLSFPVVWHFSDFPKTGETLKRHKKRFQLHMLAQNRRSSLSKDNTKTLMRSDPLLVVNWHAVVKIHPNSGFGLNIMLKNTSDSACLHHYRGACIDKFLKTTCDSMLAQSYIDETVPRYAKRLGERVENVLDMIPN